MGSVGTSIHVELGVFFLIGLLGGAHCLGMCGPLVTMYSDRMRPSARDTVLTLFQVRQHALFNLGRTVSYAVLGGVFGSLGAFVFETSAVITVVGTGVQAVSGVIVGIAILLVGVRYLLGRHGSMGVLEGGTASYIYTRLATRIDTWATGPGIVGLGLVHGLLPCPMLYPAFLYAFARGSPIGGTLALFVLGLGTFPTLFLYGTLIQSVPTAHRRHLHRVLGAAFLVMGWMPLSHGLALLGIDVPHIEPPIYQPLSP